MIDFVNGHLPVEKRNDAQVQLLIKHSLQVTRQYEHRVTRGICGFPWISHIRGVLTFITVCKGYAGGMSLPR